MCLYWEFVQSFRVFKNPFSSNVFCSGKSGRDWGWVDNCLKQTVLDSTEARYVLENVGSNLKINSH